MMTTSAALGSIHEYKIDQPSLCSPACLGRPTNHKEHVEEGVDHDFVRGWSKYDQFYGDPRMERNPNLGTREKGPFYAIEIHAGAMGTKGGPKTTVNAEAKKVGGDVILGLYAAGHAAVGLGGAGYAGASITIGTSMLTGWLAARHAVTTSRA